MYDHIDVLPQLQLVLEPGGHWSASACISWLGLLKMRVHAWLAQGFVKK